MFVCLSFKPVFDILLFSLRKKPFFYLIDHHSVCWQPSVISCSELGSCLSQGASNGMGEQSGKRRAGDQCGGFNRGKLFAQEKGLSPLQWSWISTWQVRFLINDLRGNAFSSVKFQD